MYSLHNKQVTVSKSVASFKMKMCDMSVMPTEVMLRIFRMLSNQELSKVVLVCRRWRAVGEDPSLWTWDRIIVSSYYDVKMLGIKRLQHAQEIIVKGVWGSKQLVKLFQAVARLQNISYLCMPRVNLSSLEPELLVTAAIKVEELIMFNCQITSRQAVAMFEGFSDSSKLATLAIGTNNLSLIDKDTLATVINSCNVVYMTETQLTGKQVTCLEQHLLNKTYQVVDPKVDF